MQVEASLAEKAAALRQVTQQLEEERRNSFTVIDAHVREKQALEQLKSCLEEQELANRARITELEAMIPLMQTEHTQAREVRCLPACSNAPATQQSSQHSVPRRPMPPHLAIY